MEAVPYDATVVCLVRVAFRGDAEDAGGGVQTKLRTEPIKAVVLHNFRDKARRGSAAFAGNDARIVR